jgi:uncharacterized membrane protein
MSEEPQTRSLSSHIRRSFVTGLFALIPIGITIWVIAAIFNGVDILLQPIISAIYGAPIKGVGFVATVLLVYLIGLFADNVVGRRILKSWEQFISRIPVVKGLYGGVKQVAEAFGPQSKDQFRDVVMIEFPHPGSYALGFATVAAEGPGITNSRYVFVPTTPNPTSGYLLIIADDKMKRLSISVEDGLKLVISGGVVGPGKLT